MADQTLPYSSAIGSLKELEDTCNTDELNLRKKLQSLALGDNEAGEKATLAEYKKTDRKKLGKLRIEKFDTANEQGALFKGSVYIRTQEKEVLVFRET